MKAREMRDKLRAVGRLTALARRGSLARPPTVHVELVAYRAYDLDTCVGSGRQLRDQVQHRLAVDDSAAR